MSNSTRTKWMASVISDIFNINEYDALVSIQLTISLFRSHQSMDPRDFFGG